MDEDGVAELEILVQALAANIEAYAQAALQLRRYRDYALCRRQELERRRLNDLLAEELPVIPPPVPFRSAMWLRLHRIATSFRLRRHADKMLLRDLRREDMMLLKLIAAFMEANRLSRNCHRHLRTLVETVIRADNEIAQLVRRKPSPAFAFVPSPTGAGL